MAALTGFAPVSLGLKDRDPRLLDDKAVTARPASPFTPLGAPRGLGRTFVPPDFTKNTHRRPSRHLSRDCSGGLDGRGICVRALADWLGSAVRPLREYGKRVWYSASRKRPPWDIKKPTSGREVGAYGCEVVFSASLHHFPWSVRIGVANYPVRYAWSYPRRNRSTPIAAPLNGGLLAIWSVWISWRKKAGKRVQ